MRKVERLTRELNQLRGRMIGATDAERTELAAQIRELRLEITLATPATSGRRYR
jgi:hypothetical protein